MAEDPNKPTYNLRLYLIAGVLVVFLGLLILRLWHVQVREGGKHAQEIARESIRPIRLNAVRGRLLAADGTALVDSDCRYDLMFHVSEMRQRGKRSNTIKFLIQRSLDFARMLDRPAPLNVSAVERHLHVAPAMPMVVFSDLTPAEVAKVMEMSPPVPGVSVETRAVRRYLHPGVATHVLGWVGQERPEKTEEMADYGSAYIGYEMKGYDGIERQYNDILSGQGGHKLVRVDPVGYIHEEIGIPREPVDGRDLLLTLDLKAQRTAERVLEGERGAMVVVDVTSGAILAIASSPTYPLTDLTPENNHYGELSKREDMPMFNRAVEGGYAPGSIVKPLIALAALESDAIVPSTTYDCKGVYDEHTLRIRCASQWGHGVLDLVHAIKLSCNPYFIHAGIKTGLENIQPILSSAGFGRRPGIDLPRAAKGLFPTREYAVRTRGADHPWGMADTALISIGQGLSVVTPLQAAMYTAALANGGLVYRPFLVRSVQNADGSVWRNTAPVVEHRLPVTAEHLAVVRQGMWEVVNGRGGSGSNAKNDIIELAGKTGSAEVKPRNAPKTKNTWFIAFGPFSNPKYACALMIEDGDSGGRTCAPRVKRFFEEWLGAGQSVAQPAP